MNSAIHSPVRLIASSRNWIESEAVRQLFQTARLEGMCRAIGLPDLHPGKAYPAGAAFVTEEVIYPHLIGRDIGCGMALWQTSLPGDKAQPDEWTHWPLDLEHPWEGSIKDWICAEGLMPTPFNSDLGTLGGGNHFAELQAIDKVIDESAFARTGLVRHHLLMLIHSGSRGLGESIHRDNLSGLGVGALLAESPEGMAFLAAHRDAVRWARSNRALLARRFVAALGGEGRLIWDGCHNSITSRKEGDRVRWIHRKGATPADVPLLVIPGSRGTYSYVVRPGMRVEEAAFSVAHGSGRKWSRSQTRIRMRERFKPAQLIRTAMGSRVVCADRELLYEEAPPAYKNIEVVIDDLVEAGLVHVVARLRPILTYKTRSEIA